MKTFLVIFVTVCSLLCSLRSFAQTAEVSISLRPAGSFKATSKEVKGFAEMKPDHSVEAHNIAVGLKNIATGIALRDQHTKKHLEVDKFPEAILVSAQGQGGKGTGVIKIKGIQQKISGTYSVEGKVLSAHFPLKLSDFKIEGIKYMGVGVSDEVQLDVTVPMK
jgi:hypothetical protein